MRLWWPAYIGVGSNLHDPASQVRAAMTLLGTLPGVRLEQCSSLYGSRPLILEGAAEQPDFVNAVAAVLTQQSPRELLEALQELESRAGRPARHERWGPRVLDLDLLLFGQLTLDEPGLRLPHPGVVDRNFVLYPLAQIAPELEVPGRGRVHALAARVSADGIWPLDR